MRIDDFISGGAVDLLADAIILAGLDGSILDVNSTALECYGYSRDEMLALKVADIRAPQDRESIESAIREAAEHGLHYEADHRRSDGTLFPIESRVARVSLNGETALLAAVRDITARKQAERELLASEERFRGVFESTSDAIFLLSSSGAIVWTNPAMARMHGYTVEEMLSMDVRDLDAPETARLSPGRLERLLAGEALSFESEHLCKNGRTIPLEVSANLVVIGGAKYILGFHRDITQRRRDDDTLRSSEERFRVLASRATEGIMIHENGTILDANRAFARMVGFDDPEQLVGKNGVEITPFTPASARLIGERERSGATGTFDVELIGRDGHIIFAETDGCDITYQERPATLVFMRDITERKIAEQALLESESRFRALLERANDAVYVFTVSQGQPGRFQEVNERACTMLGYSREELLGLGLQDLESPEQIGTVTDQLRTHGCATFETEHLAKGGSQVPVEVSASLFELQGEPTVLAVVRDITERRQAEHDLAENEWWLNESQRIAGLGHYIFDIQGDCWEGSPSLCEVLGMDAVCGGDFAGYLTLVHPDDREMFTRHFTEDVVAQKQPFDIVYRIIRPCDGVERWAHGLGEVRWDDDGHPVTMFGIIQDVTERKQLEEALQRRLVALTQPAAATEGLTFSDLFDIEEIQAIQDAFSEATGVASIITDPDGTPLTRPSHYTRLCRDVIQGTKKGLSDCFESAASMGHGDATGPVVRSCLNAGLWDAGASITAGGQHVANWLIGQVRTEQHHEVEMLEYADEIGADKDEFKAALAQVPTMPLERFKRIAQALYLFASELSIVAYQNVQQARLITEQQRVESDIRVLNRDLELRAEERAVLMDRLSAMVSSVIDVIDSVSEMRDPYTAGHQRRVAELAAELAREMGMPDADIADIRMAGLMHDVGKMAIPAEILSKPTALSSTELNLIRGHAEAGYSIIASAHMEGAIAELVYQHHERCDGSGYPRGLGADELLIGSKVLMVADVVESMMSHRPYRPALGQEAALAEIEQGTGRLYDAQVAEACLRVFREQGFALSEV